MSPVGPSDDVLGVFFSPSFQNEEKTSSVPNEIQGRYLIPFTVAEHPQIVNEETLWADKSTWYLIDEDIETSKVTVFQKSVPDKMAAVTPSNDTKRDPCATIEPFRTPNTEVKPDVNEKTTAPEKETMRTPKTTNTEAEKDSNTRDDVDASLEFLRRWKALNGKPKKKNPPREAPLSPMLDCKWGALNGELEEDNPPLEDPLSPVFDRKWKPLNGEPEEKNPSRKTPLSTIIEPEISKTGKNERHKAHNIKWLETSNSFLAVSSLGTMESREDDPCDYDVEETRIIE
jgi:hypothetical protein